MYFIQPNRDIPYLDQVLEKLPHVQVIKLEDHELYDATIIAIADVHDYLKYKWNLPTVVLALENEGTALAQAWEQGALAGWIWDKLPEQPDIALQKLMRNISVIRIVVIFLQRQSYKNVCYRMTLN